MRPRETRNCVTDPRHVRGPRLVLTAFKDCQWEKQLRSRCGDTGLALGTWEAKIEGSPVYGHHETKVEGREQDSGPRGSVEGVSG